MENGIKFGKLIGMKETIAWFLGADIFSMVTYHLLQTHISDFVIDQTVKIVASIFVGLIGGFMGIIGKKVGEDYIKHRKQKKERNGQVKRDSK